MFLFYHQLTFKRLSFLLKSFSFDSAIWLFKKFMLHNKDRQPHTHGEKAPYFHFKLQRWQAKEKKSAICNKVGKDQFVVAFQRVLQQEEYILQNIEPPNRCNVLSVGPQNEKVRERARGKKDESSVRSLWYLLQDEMST